MPAITASHHTGGQDREFWEADAPLPGNVAKRLSKTACREMLDSLDNRGRSAWSASSPIVWMSHMASFHVEEGPTPWMLYVLWERRAGSSMRIHGLSPCYNLVEASGGGEGSESVVNLRLDGDRAPVGSLRSFTVG